MRLATLILMALFMSTYPAMARTCEKPNACGNIIGCVSVLKGFSSYLAFNNWLAANPYVEYEVVYATSTNITIVWWTDNCKYTEKCWDLTGECTL